MVDNDEEKSIQKELHMKFPKVFYIPNKNKGFGQGNNVGAKKAKGDYLFFLNPDTKLLNNTIDILAGFLNKNKEVGIAAPSLFDRKNKPFQLQGSLELNPLRAVFALSFLVKLFPQNKFYQEYYLQNWDKKSLKEVDVAPGTAFMIKKDIYEKIGGFDENFFLYFEEFDLCRRIKKIGLKIFINPDAKVYHSWGASTEKTEIPTNIKIKEAVALLEKNYKKEILAIGKRRADRETGHEEQDALINTIYDQEKAANPEFDLDKKMISQAFEKVMFKYIRKDVVEKNKRIDGRAIDELRPLGAEVSILPRTHGSAIFQRGLTQALTIATLGSPRMELIIESAEGEETKRYIHHYSMPPYSVGETGRMMSPSRREIGHGALAERALLPVIPSKEIFPYTIRVVSEIMSSNGSTSMASTCGSTLALMDAGVPITSPVAGISVGMMSDGDNYVLLTDIIGLEDFAGDMDFKVAGTDAGVTAIQLDVKVPGITMEQISETFARAKSARAIIMKKMLSVMPKFREKVSEYAPKIELIKIPVDKIGEVIGPGGKNIKAIIAQTGASVEVEDDGTVAISGISGEAVQKAVDWITGMTREVNPGEVFPGTVKRILPFGAFVEYLPGKEGMVHVSKMGKGFVKHPEDVVSIGQAVTVKVMEIDQMGRVNLTMVIEDAGTENDQPAQPAAPQTFESQPHPLTQQFRREKFQSRDKFPARPRKRFSR